MFSPLAKEMSADMSLPQGLSMYQGVLAGGARHLKQPNADGSAQDDEDTTATNQSRPFNHRFGDVREILQDGEPPLVMMTGNQKPQAGVMAKRKFGEYSLLLRRISRVDGEAKPPKLQLEIQSDLLRQEFRRMAWQMTSISLTHNPIIIPEPYEELYHCSKKIREALDQATTEDMRRELQLLIDFQRDYMSDTRKSIKSYTDYGTIEFDWLWGIFVPGEHVVIQNTSATAAPVEWIAVLKSSRIIRDPDGPATWEVEVTHTSFNGRRFGMAETEFSFPSFSGTISITELPIYPLQFCSHRDDLKTALTVRGVQYETYCLASAKGRPEPLGTPREYEGPFWVKRTDIDDPDSHQGCRIQDNPGLTISGRVIVDIEGFLVQFPAFRDTLIPEKTGPASPFNERRNSQEIDYFYLRRQFRHVTAGSETAFAAQVPRQPLTSEQHLTCPPLIPAYSFANRCWGFVLVEELSEIKWKSDVFEKVQVDEGVKRTLRGLVKGHSNHPGGFDDFVPGKGRGLVFLLSGPPGCGKTLTAESISESLEKPLYSVSGGELGTDVYDVQEALERAFRMASRWQAIFLLDEADSFLAAREGGNVERNALVSVFLRLLEYQSGIMFLTTNRVLDLDPAFHSRIHISIRYSDLDETQRAHVWRSLAEEKCDCKLSVEETADLARLPINGRNIKNVLRLASLFAKTRDEEADMRYSDIVAVLPLALDDPPAEGPKLQDGESQRPERETKSSALAKIIDKSPSSQRVTVPGQ